MASVEAVPILDVAVGAIQQCCQSVIDSLNAMACHHPVVGDTFMFQSHYAQQRNLSSDGHYLVSQQVALRLAGVHIGEVLNVVLDGARVYVCGIHLNSGDGNRVEGVPLVYASDRQFGDTERLQNTNLVVFEKETGGRGVRITTSDPDYVCVMTICADCRLHSNVFPDSLVLPCVVHTVSVLATGFVLWWLPIQRGGSLQMFILTNQFSNKL